jgi:tetratricopeptide (TPR) repeat protein
MNHAAEAEKDFAAARAKAKSPECRDLAAANVALQQALEAFDAAVAKATDDAAIQDSLGFVLPRLASYEESIAAYDATLKLRPKASYSLYRRGIALRRKDNTIEGDADIPAAIALYAKVGESFEGYGIKP